MSKKSPKELDKLFQREPEQYPFPYNEASWNEMEKLLDKDDRRRFLWWWIFGISALLLIGSVFFFWKNENPIVEVDANVSSDKKEILNQKIESKSKTDNHNLSKKDLDENDISNRSVDNQDSVSKDLKENDESNLTSNKIKADFSNQSNSNLRSSLNKKFQQDIYKNQDADTDLDFGKVNFGKIENINTNLVDSVLEKTNTSDGEFLLKKDSVRVLLQNESILPIAFLEIFVSGKNKILEMPLVEKEKKESPSKKKNPILFGILLGAESTGADASSLSELNWKIGTQLEYRFLNRYSASIGANFIQKKYSANGDAYNPDNDWMYNIAPESVRAACDILEVPVNIGFFQKGFNENGFYSKLGLSSFFMLEEHYWYSYENPLPGQSRYWKGFNENRHWFGIGEIYVGYQHILSPITSMQIEPYFQIPLTGVGNGNVKLWSIGMNLRFNFQAN